MMAANKITERKGWVQAETKRRWNISQITEDCICILRNMDYLDCNIYEARLKGNGYDVMLRRDSYGKVVDYSVRRGNSTYKSSDIGHNRNLTPSKIRRTWLRLYVEQHPENTLRIRPISPNKIDGTKTSRPKQDMCAQNCNKKPII